MRACRVDEVLSWPTQHAIRVASFSTAAMLPTDMHEARAMNAGGRYHGGSSLLPPYIRRALSTHQMDWEYAFTQMVYCCTAPGKLYVRGLLRRLVVHC